MITKNDLINDGVEYISGKTQIKASFSNNCITVSLFPDYPKTEKTLSLYLKIDGQNTVTVTDLRNKGVSTRKEGYGRLIFNIGIQLLHLYFGSINNSSIAKSINISGTASPQSDLKLPEEEKALNIKYREKFWGDSGFEYLEPENPHSEMKATLDSLKIRKSGLCHNRCSKFIDINSFWVKSQRPLLFQSDIASLHKIQLHTDNILSLKELKLLDEQETLAMKKARWLSHIPIGLVVLITAMYNSQYLFTINFITLAGIFYVISVHLLGYKVVDLIPSYKSSKKDKKEHSQAIGELNKSIEIIEEKHNGLIWRLHDALIKHDPALDTEINKNLVRLSKEQSFASLANQYRDYVQYINEAKILIT